MNIAFIVTFLTLGISISAADLSERVLAEINLARTAPHAYSQVVLANAGRSPAPAVAEAIRYLEKTRPLAPLSLSSGLSQGANLHVAEQGPRGCVGHNGSGWGNTPWARMARFGQWIGCAGENIDYGHRAARQIVCAWIIDAGVSGRGHRKNLFSPYFRVAGVACGPHAAYGSMCVIDFAGNYLEGIKAITRL